MEKEYVSAAPGRLEELVPEETSCPGAPKSKEIAWQDWVAALGSSPSPPAQGERDEHGVLTNLRDMGVLSSSGRCCSRASTMQLAMMVARIMYSKGVEGS